MSNSSKNNLIDLEPGGENTQRVRSSPPSPTRCEYYNLRYESANTLGKPYAKERGQFNGTSVPLLTIPSHALQFIYFLTRNWHRVDPTSVESTDAWQSKAREKEAWGEKTGGEG